MIVRLNWSEIYARYVMGNVTVRGVEMDFKVGDEVYIKGVVELDAILERVE